MASRLFFFVCLFLFFLKNSSAYNAMIFYGYLISALGGIRLESGLKLCYKDAFFYRFGLNDKMGLSSLTQDKDCLV